MISEEHELLCDVISNIYMRVDWRKITSLKRSAVDILTDRVRVACKEQDILKAHDKLCATLNISTSKQDVDILESLYHVNDTVMSIMREHTGYVAALSQKKAKDKIEELKRLKEIKDKEKSK